MNRKTIQQFITSTQLLFKAIFPYIHNYMTLFLTLNILHCNNINILSSIAYLYANCYIGHSNKG